MHVHQKSRLSKEASATKMGEGLNPICGCHMSMVPYITPTAIRQRDITHKRSILLPNEEIPCGLIILHLTIITSSCHHEERFVICFMCHKWFHYILVYNIIFSFNQIGYTPSTQRRRRKRNLETCAPARYPTACFLRRFGCLISLWQVCRAIDPP